MGRKRRTHTAGFTLVELLVVIGIIALLVSILMPALIGARRASQKAVCTANLQTIGKAVHLYAMANRDYLPRAPAGAQWVQSYKTPGEPAAYLRLADYARSTGTSAMFNNAYWGAAYLRYIASLGVAEATGDETTQIIKFAEKVWRCPSSVSTLMLSGNVDPDSPISYGISTMLTNYTRVSPGPPLVTQEVYLKKSRVKSPSQVIFCHDSAKATLRGNEMDSLTANGGQSNLKDFRPEFGGTLVPYKLDAIFEYYRHSRASNVLWFDGHVDVIRYSKGTDVPPQYYSGWK